MTYVLLIYSARADEPGEAARALDAHRALQAEAAAAGELRAVAKLPGTHTARTVRARSDGRHEVTDGPFMETKEWLVGFYLVDCADEAAALARAREICLSDAHSIEVRPADWVWRARNANA